MNLVTALLTNGAYGYPRGAARRRKPVILACLHQTANRATAMQERNYANRAHSTGPSASAYIDRDGSIVRAILPGRYAAWSQGDLDHPDLTVPTVKAAVASGVNMTRQSARTDLLDLEQRGLLRRVVGRRFDFLAPDNLRARLLAASA